MSSAVFQQRRRGASFRETYCDALHDWSDDEYGPTGADSIPFRRSPSLSNFDGFLLPPQSREDIESNRLTVVFDLDETLIFGRKGPLYVRPGIDKLFSFLKSNNVEVVVWTSSVHRYADAVVAQIDEDNCIAHVIYRHRSWFKNVISTSGPNKEKNSLKDLSLLGRRLENVVIFENTPDCLLGFEENGVLVEDYVGGELADYTVFGIAKLLQELLTRRAGGSTPSVQEYIRSCSRLQREELVTDKGSRMVCYCLPSHDDHEDCCLPLPAAERSASRKSRIALLEDSRSSSAASYQSRRKTTNAYRAMLFSRESTAAKRRYEAQKITSH